MIERIGYLMLYPRFEQSLGMEGGAMNMRCYRDDDVSYSTLSATECGFTVRINDLSAEVKPMIHPNPGTDHFVVQLSAGPHLIRVFDTNGRELFAERTNGTDVRIGAVGLPAGLYAVRVDDGPPMRWMKQ